jgi:hypothetical protein
MLKAYHKMLRSEEGHALPIYVNFKLSLRLEPLYIKTPNAPFWFNKWLIAKIYSSTHETLRLFEDDSKDKFKDHIPDESLIANLLNSRP